MDLEEEKFLGLVDYRCKLFIFTLFSHNKKNEGQSEISEKETTLWKDIFCELWKLVHSQSFY